MRSTDARKFFGLALACASVMSFTTASLAYESPAYDRACREMARRDWDGAIISFGEVIGFDMNNRDAYFKRGQCFYHLNNFTQSINDFSHILDFNPKDVDASIWRGTANARMGDHESAVRDFLSAIRLDPTLAKNYQQGGGERTDNIEVVQAGHGEIRMSPESVSYKAQNQGAVQDYQRAMALYMKQKNSDELPSPTVVKGPGAQADDANMPSRPERKHRQEQQDKALENADDESDGKKLDRSEVKANITKLNASLELDQRNSSLWYKRARMYERLQNYDQALQDLSKAIDLYPMSSGYYIERARVYHQMNQPDLAQADLAHARSVDPTVPNQIKFVDEGKTTQRQNRNFRKPIE